jgi:hypothetical protein
LNKLKIVIAFAIKADLCVSVHTLKQLPCLTLFNISFCNPLHMYVFPVPGSPVIKQPLSSSNLNFLICVSSVGFGHSSLYSDCPGAVIMHLVKSLIAVFLIPPITSLSHLGLLILASNIIVQ